MSSITKWAVRLSTISLGGNHVTHHTKRFDSQGEAETFAASVANRADPNLHVYSVGVDHSRSH